MNKLILILAVTLSTVFANADILQLTPGSEVKEGVNISTGGVVTVKSGPQNLVTVGSGIRKKYLIGSFGTKVYVAQLMVANPATYDKANALASVGAQTSAAFSLSFVTTVPAAKVYGSFEDGLVANGVDIGATDIGLFLDSVKNAGEASNGKSLTLVFVNNADGSETLSYEHTNGDVKEISGPAGLKQKVLSIWLGNTVADDDGLAELKAELLK